MNARQNKHSGRIEVRLAQKHIAGLLATAQQLYRKALEFDGLPVDTKFAVFSEGNKYAEFYNLAMGQYFAAKREYQAGGYVGLTLSGNPRKSLKQ